MVTERQFASAHDVYYAVLKDLAQIRSWTDSVLDSTSIGSGFGGAQRRTKELIGYKFSIGDPRRRWTFSGPRKANFGFAVANAIWTLSGSNDLSGIAAYSQRAAAFASPDRILEGAIGHRLRGRDSGNQIDSLVDLLRRDPSSRRAVAQTYLPRDLIKPILDVPCSLGFQFLVRLSGLVGITYMRSQSALMLLPYDLFLFLLMHEAIAVSLHVDLGDYHHFCGSIHYYEDEESLVESVVASEQPQAPQAMPAMRLSPFERGFSLFEAERSVRESLTKAPEAEVSLAGYGLDEYWLQLLRVVVVYLKRQLGSLSWKEDYEELPETYRLWLGYGESYDPLEIAPEAFKASGVPIAVISLYDLMELVRFESTVWDIVTYFEARFRLWRQQRLLVQKEFEIYQDVWSYWPELTVGHGTEGQAKGVQDYQMSISNAIMRSNIATEEGYADLAASILLDFLMRAMTVEADRDKGGKPVSDFHHGFIVKSIGAISEMTRLRRTEYGKRLLDAARKVLGTTRATEKMSYSPSRDRAYLFVAFGEHWSVPMEPYLARRAQEHMEESNAKSCFCIGGKAIEIIATYENFLAAVKGERSRELTEEEVLAATCVFVERNQ